MRCAPSFRGYEIRPLKDFLSLMTSASLPGLDAFVNSMIALAVAIGFLVIFLSMYTTVIERTRDIGVLKSLGASKGYIMRALLSETAIICAGGNRRGHWHELSACERFSCPRFPPCHPHHAGWIVRAALIAVAGGLVARPIPRGWPAAKTSIEALAYD